MSITHYDDDEEFYALFTRVEGPRGVILIFREGEGVTTDEQRLAEQIAALLVEDERTSA